MSMVLPVITAAAMGAGFARLTFLMFDLFEDENGGTMDARIAALDTLMRRMVKPKTIVTSADGDDATGVYRAAAWPAISVKDLFYAEVDKNCGPACVTHPEDQDEGPVKFVRESQFTKRLMTDEGAVEGDGDAQSAPERPPCDHGGEDGSCYICFERDMNSILLPCGHSGVCYQCAIENVARCETCPCCRQAVDQVVVYDAATKRRDADGNHVYSVIGPGAVKSS